jgi:transcriptional regulator with XRE-family HTH domain
VVHHADCYAVTIYISKQLHPRNTDIMTERDIPENLAFNPNHLLDTIIERMKLKNDAALSRLLSVAPPLISKIRHGRLPVGASLLIRMHEETNISIRELRELMGDRRAKFRISDVQGKPVATNEQVP